MLTTNDSPFGAPLIISLVTFLVIVFPAPTAQIRIDLDRNTEGVQDTLTLPAGLNNVPISGQVIVRDATSVNSNVIQVFVEGACDPAIPVIDTTDGSNSLSPCDVTGGAFAPYSYIHPTDFIWVNPFPVPWFSDEFPPPDVCLLTFDLMADFAGLASDQILFRYETSRNNPALGIQIAGLNYSFGEGGENPPIEAIGASIILSGSNITPCPTFSPTQTPTEFGQLTSTRTLTPSRTTTLSPTVTLSPTITFTPTITRTPTSSFTVTETVTPSTTPTLTLSPTPSVTPTPTPSLAPCDDSGFYLLTGFGEHVPVGSPPVIGGNVAGSEPGKFFDMEPAHDLDGSIDLAILDGMGTVTFVGNPGSTPSQDFLFPVSDEFPKGRAVDVEVSHTGQGAWVLTDFGGIYRMGDTKNPADPSLVPGSDTLPLGYDVLYGPMRSRAYPNPGGASLRAVGIAVLDLDPMDSRADGYIILDSQGAHYSFLGDGTPVQPGTFTSFSPHDPLKLLAVGPAGYGWPFFQGMDIARDIELLPVKKDGIAVFDGWGGIHPVPALDPTSVVYYLHNFDRNHPGSLLTTVGMPYITKAFDNPDTTPNEADPGAYGADVASIFVDLEFCTTGDGIYTLDRFGGVFAFGSARSIPESTSAPFPGGPYYFPYMWAVDIEPFETVPGR